MSEAKYNVGDTVTLNSGGPVMTVQAARQHTGNTGELEFTGSYTCQWFSGKKLESGIFPEESLKEVTE